MLPGLSKQCCLWMLCCWTEYKSIHLGYHHCQWGWCSEPAMAAGEPRRIHSPAAVAATSGDASNVEEHGIHTKLSLPFSSTAFHWQILANSQLAKRSGKCNLLAFYPLQCREKQNCSWEPTDRLLALLNQTFLHPRHLPCCFPYGHLFIYLNEHSHTRLPTWPCFPPACLSSQCRCHIFPYLPQLREIPLFWDPKIICMILLLVLITLVWFGLLFCFSR